MDSYEPASDSFIKPSTTIVQSNVLSLFNNTNEKMNSFTLFPKLPLETRWMIWNLAIPQDRVVTIGNSISTTRKPRRDRCFLDFHIQHNKTPAILHTCIESRQEALKHYTLLKDFKIKNPFYFNFARDVLLFNGPDGVDALSQFCLFTTLPDFYQMVRYLAVNGNGDLPNNEINVISHFTSLDQIILLSTTKSDVNYQLFTAQKLNWACNYRREQDRVIALRKKVELQIMSDRLSSSCSYVQRQEIKLQAISTRLSFCFDHARKVSRVIRKELDQQAYQNAPGTMKVVFLSPNDLGRYSG